MCFRPVAVNLITEGYSFPSQHIVTRFMVVTNNNGVLHWIIGFIAHSFTITRNDNNSQ
jgi:hypothetical protein